MDVFVQRIRLPIPHGIRNSKQLYGVRRHESHERILGRRSSRGYRRLQGKKKEKTQRDIYDERSIGFHEIDSSR